MAAFLGGAISQVKTRLAVDNATSSVDEPTPIYVLDELVATLSAGDARAAVDAVCARLAHRSPVVKQKALKLVAHIGRRGGADLRRLMARHSGAVRDLLHYRCEPDPFKGDTVWKRVQEYAQEALEAVHGTGAETGAAASGGLGSGNTLGGRIQGFGSEAAAGYGGGGGGMMAFGSDSGGGSRAGRMVGFGSTDVGSQSGYSSFSGAGATSSSSRYGSALRPAASGGLSQPIVQAGAALGSGASAAAAVPATASGAAQLGAQHAAEQRLVDRICTPAGLRATPGSEDLKAFVEGLGPLDGSVVAQLLEKKLEAGPWQAALRALCAIEAVAESGSSASAGQVAVHFQADPGPVRRAARSPQASVRQRAQKLLGLLGDEPAGAGSGSTAAAAAPVGLGAGQQQQQFFTEDLLGDSEPAGAGAAASATASDLADMLGEPASAAATAAPAASPVDLLAGLDVSAAPAPTQQSAAAPAASAVDDIFGGMLFGSSSQQHAPGVAAGPSAASSAGAPDLDLLGGLSLGPAPTLPAQPQQPLQPARQQQRAQGTSGSLGDLLGGLSLGSAPGAGNMGSMRATDSSGSVGMGAGPMRSGSMGVPAGGVGAGMASGVAGSSMQPLQYGAAPTTAAMLRAALMGGAMPAFQQHSQQNPQHMPLGGLSSLGSGGLHSMPHHGRQPSLGLNGTHSGGGAVLGELGILDSTKDNSFNFVDDAIAAAKRRT